MTAGPNAMRTLPLFERFIRFSLVGIAGFTVDVSILLLCLGILQLGPYLGRVVSYLGAATTTWLLNRRFTFPEATHDRPHAQWARFVVVNAVGGTVNYGTYAGLVMVTDVVANHPVLGVAAGSVVGLLFNFTGSRLLVFHRSQRLAGVQKSLGTRRPMTKGVLKAE